MSLNKDDLENFWKIIKNLFKKSPKKIEVIKLLLMSGFSIKNKKIYCNNIEIPNTSIASALKIDRRSVIGTIEKIYPSNNEISKLNDEDKKSLAIIQKVLNNIFPVGIFVWDNNKKVIEVTADSKEFGIISNVTKFIADEKISIRQIIATDPDLDLNPRLTIFTNEEVPGETLSKILEIKGVLTASYGKR
ncbi:MAG: hypothetical protein ACTSWG_09085 [Candidatus Helarchaeota archaeon]